jgi:hypothetical protein
MEILMLIRRVSVAAIFALTITGFAGAASAAGCYDANQSLTPAAISAFTSNPGDVLGKSPDGGGALIAQVRDLAASDSATLPAIMGLLKSANDDQKRSIGAGLAQAARICVPKDPAYANQIQVAIADSKDPVLVLAYAAGAGNQPIGAGGAGAGSPGASGGGTTGLGVPTGVGGSVEAIGGNGVNTGQFSYTGSTGSSSSVSPF